MKTKVLCFLVASCVLGAAAWFVHIANPASSEQKVANGGDGTKKAHDMLEEGLNFLVKAQQVDGHWEGDGGQHPVAMTGLVGLALIVQYSPHVLGDPRSIKHADSIRKAADWLMSKSPPKREGLIFSDHSSETARYMQGHGLATLFLAGQVRHETDLVRRQMLNDVLGRAVKYLVKSQSSQGGWHDTSRLEGHDFDSVAATAIQVQALQACEITGIPILGETLKDAKAYLKKVLAKDEKAEPGKIRSQVVDIAATLICHANEVHGGRGVQGIKAIKDAWSEQWFKHCQKSLLVGHDLGFAQDALTHYYFAQFAYHREGQDWQNYLTALQNALQKTQNRDGGWPASEGLGVGRVYATALWCIILQLPRGSHPSRQEIFMF